MALTGFSAITMSSLILCAALVPFGPHPLLLASAADCRGRDYQRAVVVAYPGTMYSVWCYPIKCIDYVIMSENNHLLFAKWLLFCYYIRNDIIL